jgi:hypothetical protein
VCLLFRLGVAAAAFRRQLAIRVGDPAGRAFFAGDQPEQYRLWRA